MPKKQRTNSSGTVRVVLVNALQQMLVVAYKPAEPKNTHGFPGGSLKPYETALAAVRGGDRSKMTIGHPP